MKSVYTKRGLETRSGYTSIGPRSRIYFIAINNCLRRFTELAEVVLLHEMIHARYPQIGHGSVFQKERRRLVKAGALDEII